MRSLLKLKNEEQQLDVLNRIYKNNLNVRQTDDLIENVLIAEEENTGTEKKENDESYQRYEDFCQYHQGYRENHSGRRYACGDLRE